MWGMPGPWVTAGKSSLLHHYFSRGLVLTFMTHCETVFGQPQTIGTLQAKRTWLPLEIHQKIPNGQFLTHLHSWWIFSQRQRFLSLPDCIFPRLFKKRVVCFSKQKKGGLPTFFKVDSLYRVIKLGVRSFGNNDL